MVSIRPSYMSQLNEYYCVSTDVKPVGDGVKNGSTMREMDTGKKYMFDAEHQTWLEWPTSGGQSSGSVNQNNGSQNGSNQSSNQDSSQSDSQDNNMSSGNNIMIVPVNVYETGTITCSYTFADLYSAYTDGKLIFVRLHYYDVTEEYETFTDIPMGLYICNNGGSPNQFCGTADDTEDNDWVIEFTENYPAPVITRKGNPAGTQPK